MINAVSRSSRLGKYRYSADDAIPSSRAIARSDRPSAPCSAICRRASVVIARVSSRRATARADVEAFTGPTLPGRRERQCTTRAPLLTDSEMRRMLCNESSALESQSKGSDMTDLPGRPLPHARPHDHGLQLGGGLAGPGRGQHSRQPRAAGPRPAQRGMADHSGQPAGRRRSAIPGGAARTDPVGPQHPGGRRRRTPAGTPHRAVPRRRAAGCRTSPSFSGGT